MIAADNKYVGYRPAGNGATWLKKRKIVPDSNPNDTVDDSENDNNDPVSPVLVGPKIIFIAERCATDTGYVPGTPVPCGIATYKIAQDGNGVYKLTGPLAFARLSVTSGQTTRYYETLNTPTVDTQHGRVYIVASELCGGCSAFEARKGNLFVADIDKSSGAISNLLPVSPFPGPSGASPVLALNKTISGVTGNALYFDGLAHYAAGGSGDCTNSTATGTETDGCFYGFMDSTVGTVATPAVAQVWTRKFIGRMFQAGGARDPRGGIWVYPLFNPSGNDPVPTCGYSSNPTEFGNCLIRLDESNGNNIGVPVDVGAMLNGGTQPTSLVKAFGPSSALTLYGGSQNVYLTFGAWKVSGTYLTSAPKVVSVDVSNANAPSLLWSTTTLAKGTLGQFPVVQYGNGTHFKVVFTGRDYGPYMYGY